MTRDEFEKQFDNVIEEPLLDEDGFLNQKCLDELADAIKNMPPDHIRLSGDIEWTTPRWTSLKEITAALAYWAIRQGTACEPETAARYHPPNLEKIIGYLHCCLLPVFKDEWIIKLSLCDISKLLHSILMDCKVFGEWNDWRVMGEKYWLDLHALICNACLVIRDERRKNDAFDQKFDREWYEDYSI